MAFRVVEGTFEMQGTVSGTDATTVVLTDPTQNAEHTAPNILRIWVENPSTCPDVITTIFNGPFTVLNTTASGSNVQLVGAGETSVTTDGNVITISGTPHPITGEPDVDSINTATGTITINGADGITVLTDLSTPATPTITVSGFETSVCDKIVTTSGYLQTQIDSVGGGPGVILGAGGNTVISGSNEVTVSGFYDEFVSASGSLQNQIDTINVDEIEPAIVGADGITVISGANTTTVSGFRTEFVSASGSLQNQIDGIDSSVTLQEAYDNGDGIIETSSSAKPVVISGSTVGDLLLIQEPTTALALRVRDDYVQVNNPLRGASGSAATPSYTFTNDIDTGLYQDASDVLGISAGGDLVVVVSGATTGNEGVGIDGKLTVDRICTVSGIVSESLTVSGSPVVLAPGVDLQRAYDNSPDGLITIPPGIGQKPITISGSFSGFDHSLVLGGQDVIDLFFTDIPSILSIYGEASFGHFTIRGLAPGAQPQFYGTTARGSFDAPQISQGGDVAFAMGGLAHDGDNYAPLGGINAVVGAPVVSGSNIIEGRLVFFTTDSTGDQNSVMNVHSTQSVSINESNPATVDPYSFYVAGSGIFTEDLSVTNAFDADTGAFTTSLTVSGSPVCINCPDFSQFATTTELVTVSGYLQTQIDNINVDEIEPAIVGVDGITVTSGTNTTVSGFRDEFVSASGSLQSQIDSIDVDETEPAIIGVDGITVISGASTTTVSGFRDEFVAASGSLQSQLTGFDLQDVYDNGDGTISTTSSSKPVEITGSAGEIFVVTDRFLVRGDFIEIQDPLRGQDGSASIPTYSFTDDTDTGIYRFSDNTIGLTAGGVPKFTVSSSALDAQVTDLDNVDTLSARAVALSGTSVLLELPGAAGTGSPTSYIFEMGGGSSAGTEGGVTTFRMDDCSLSFTATNEMVFDTGDTNLGADANKVRYQASGSVFGDWGFFANLSILGIGFEIFRTSALVTPRMDFTNPYASIRLRPASGFNTEHNPELLDADFRVNGLTDYMIFMNAGTGRVGINTSTPSERLHVVGSGIVEGQLSVNTTNDALYPPRLTDGQKAAIVSPAEGATIFNTTSGTVNVHDGTSWRTLAYA